MKRAESVVCPIRVLPLNLAKLLLTTTWSESFLAEHTHDGSSSANDGIGILKSVSNEPFIAPVRFHVCDSDPAVELRCRPFHPVHVGVTAWVSRATGELDREMQEPGLFVGAVVTHRHASVTKRLVLRVRLPDQQAVRCWPPVRLDSVCAEVDVQISPPCVRYHSSTKVS